MTAILIDGRAFVAGRRTGVGRFLEGLLLAVRAAHPDWLLTVAMTKQCALPASLASKVDTLYPPHAIELWWPRLAKGYDLFLSPDPKLPWLRLPCPAVHAVHDALYLTDPAYRGNALRAWGASLRLRRALRQAALSWFDSGASQVACAGICEGAAEVRQGAVRLPAVDISFSPAEDEASDSPYFLYVGNGLPHKYVLRLIDAIRDVDARLVLVGVRDNDALLAGVDAETRAKVSCPDSVDDSALLQLYRGASALLLPSTTEGAGYPPLEAMACGTPAIVADIPVLREITGEAAMLCASNDTDAWRQAMRAMLDPGERAAWVAKGIAWVTTLQAPQGWTMHIADLERLVSGRRQEAC